MKRVIDGLGIPVPRTECPGSIPETSDDILQETKLGKRRRPQSPEPEESG